MALKPAFRLIDGSLMNATDRREATLRRMAKDLVASGEHLESDRDAVRVLMAKSYHYMDVGRLAGEARMLAYQEIVAREVSEP